MDKQLHDVLVNEPEKSWGNNYIKQQIDKRSEEKKFLTNDHIRGIVYSMLSNQRTWSAIANNLETIDEIFCNYDPVKLLACSPEQLQNELQEKSLGNRNIAQQMKALLTVIIPKLMQWEKEYASVDNYYRTFINEDTTLLTLVKNLSDSKSKDKLVQMDIPLVCEYLRNVGYDIPKPDGHIRRILGRNILAFSKRKEASYEEVFTIISEIARMLNKQNAEVDYILWSYCAKDYGEICTRNTPSCEKCVIQSDCRSYLKSGCASTEECKYLLYVFYDIRENDGISDLVYKASQKAYLDFCRRMSYQEKFPYKDSRTFSKEVSHMLSEQIPVMLESVRQEDASQKLFDLKHKEMCDRILREFDSTGGQTYGIAQRWLNLTLMHMAVMEPLLATRYLPVVKARKYFHIPVSEPVIEAASCHVTDRYKHSLYLPCAPMKHDSDTYELGWYVPGKTQPYEKWEYAEYIEFQNTVRDRLSNAIKEHLYRDALDWSLQAFMEVSQAKVIR